MRGYALRRKRTAGDVMHDVYRVVLICAMMAVCVLGEAAIIEGWALLGALSAVLGLCVIDLAVSRD